MIAEMTASQIVALSYDRPIEVCAIYFLIHGREIVYIGQSKNYTARFKTHADKENMIFDRCYHYECSFEKLRTIERAMILKHRPIYNNDQFLQKIRAEEAKIITKNQLFQGAGI